jgi:CheY-like chemotaxis protein
MAGFVTMSEVKIKLGDKKKRVLLIDDEREFTDLLNSTLELHEDYEVCVENLPHRALETARNFKPDVVVLDIVMPEVDGGAVHAQFKADAALKHIPIIYLTAIVQGQGAVGDSYYVAKPISARTLISVIAERMGR